MSTSITTEITKQLMADSLKKLMLEKPLNKISIREIVEDCGVNRQTFYYHFPDIYGLLEWILEKEILSILEDNDNFLTWQEAGVYLLRYMEKNSTILLCALNSLGRNAIKRFLHFDVKNVATRYITQVASDIDVSEEDFDHVVHYFTICFASLLEDWLSSGSDRSPEEVIDILDTIVSGTARAALERFAEKRKSR
ncbi:TetR/AcrR family transcriptional regulator C-terminal domain-containing protein [Clostridium aminobutyricum]|uniref:TetR/AcrR family transcriptional regulator C-terminal domain-containing protein n=1 Tax=Clostridium aminobutyricum TaxID=33953 RepID=A0A939D881_CLOAM|nr:TetR/AcrR family transcriptional regulator C-terminal domain-containing protein [Clostridium aminobutyricum]MBN7773224.1 TetR/AcrR family transcriptional regulator C-terminal domain-containing protein [Clostridium aminobutyricum]